MKDIKDYLHLYLGCEVRTYSGRGVLQSFDTDGRWFVHLHKGGATVGNINDKHKPCPEESKKAFPKGYPPDSILVPILRPLSDMTADEEIEYNMLRYVQRATPVHQIMVSVDSPESFRWMLSKGFDLFGLIEAGLAIDKTTLKQTA